MSTKLLRSLPSIDRLLASRVVAEVSDSLGRDRARDLLREITDELRQEIISGQWSVTSSQLSEEETADNGQLTTDMIAEIEKRLSQRAEQSARPSLRRVINATGVILHTNLGRAPLARRAIDAISEIAAGYSNLEYDLDRGERGKRESHCQELLARLLASEAATVANNNAAAVLLVLNTLAEGGEVIVSRGELIEIGGSFRIPDVMEKSGARLREVGTTNRTRIEDYERAINENTRLLLRVHPSNYRIVGFTHRPSVEEIAELARRAGLPSFEDLGSGCLLDLAPFGVTDEPVVSHSLRAGIAVVSFSGDKMLGGPQAGIIAGQCAIIERVKKNPLMRALRVDKLTYSALEATLRLYERGCASEEVPVIRAMAANSDELRRRAERLAERINEAQHLRAEVEEGESVIGGGSAPEVKLPTAIVAVTSERLSAAALEERLRRHATPIIVRAERDLMLIDLRTVESAEESIIIEALAAIDKESAE
ncbi:MAG: L-seryl-tRNA(Sec) selenium transferase [Acidobacteriota bacterium]